LEVKKNDQGFQYQNKGNENQNNLSDSQRSFDIDMLQTEERGQNKTQNQEQNQEQVQNPIQNQRQEHHQGQNQEQNKEQNQAQHQAQNQAQNQQEKTPENLVAPTASTPMSANTRRGSMKLTLESARNYLEHGEGDIRIEYFDPDRGSVKVVNNSILNTADISGWKISSEKNSKKFYTFPKGTTVSRARPVQIHKESGRDEIGPEGSIFYWNDAKAWVAKDSAVLTNLEGHVVSRYSS